MHNTCKSIAVIDQEILAATAGSSEILFAHHRGRALLANTQMEGQRK